MNGILHVLHSDAYAWASLLAHEQATVTIEHPDATPATVHAMVSCILTREPCFIIGLTCIATAWLATHNVAPRHVKARDC